MTKRHSSRFFLSSHILILLIISTTTTQATNSTYPVLTSTSSNGVAASLGLFSGMSPSFTSTYCPDREVEPCQPIASDRVCLSNTMLSTAFAGRTNVLESLFSRHDLLMTIENQDEPSSMLVGEMLRILFTEVSGYSVKIIANGVFHNQLPRCTNGLYDFHAQIWRTDWTDQEWLDVFSGDEDSVCQSDGPVGLIGRNGWFADTHSVDLSAASGTAPLDFWRSYSTVSAVANLPRFNLTAALLDADNIWFIPPQCNYTGAICGVAYSIDIYWEPGVAQQQVTNLGWLVAIVFPSTHDLYYEWVSHLLNTRQQALFFYFVPDTFSASALQTRVALPDPTDACYPHNDTDTHFDGVGPTRCDFRPQNLQKISRINTDTDRQDAHILFSRFTVPHEAVVGLLGRMFLGENMADLACEWITTNTDTWTSWFKTATPRRSVAVLPSSSKSVIYAFLAVYFIFNLCSHAFLFYNRNHVVIRRSSYAFNQVIVFGASLWYTALIIGLESDTSATCISTQFIMSLAFSFFYGSLLVKTYRIDKIFTSSKLQTQNLPDSVMFGYLAAYTALDMILVILWAAIDPPHQVLVSHSSETYVEVSTCSSSNTNVFRTVLYFIRGVSLLLGAFFAIRIRNVDSNYNESKFLALITYNILIISAIVLGITLIGSNDPKIVEGSWMGGVSFAVFASLLVFMLPKIYALWSSVKPKGAPSSWGMVNKDGTTHQPSPTQVLDAGETADTRPGIYSPSAATVSTGDASHAGEVMNSAAAQLSPSRPDGSVNADMSKLRIYSPKGNTLNASSGGASKHSNRITGGSTGVSQIGTINGLITPTNNQSSLIGIATNSRMTLPSTQSCLGSRGSSGSLGPGGVVGVESEVLLPNTPAASNHHETEDGIAATDHPQPPQQPLRQHTGTFNFNTSISASTDGVDNNGLPPTSSTDVNGGIGSVPSSSINDRLASTIH